MNGPGLAPRTVRLAAVAIDCLITVPLFVVWSVAAAGSFGLSLGALATHLQERPWLAQAGTMLVGALAWVAFAISSLALGFLVLYQWFLLSTRGQTIGKRLMGIRIVNLDGTPAGFVSAVLLRGWVFYGVMSLVVSFTSVLIPFAGLLFWFFNYVPLLGEERRCLHDYVAGTQVRWVRVVEVYVGRLIGAVAAVALIALSVTAVIKRDALMLLVEPKPQAVAVLPAPAPALAPVPTAPGDAPEPISVPVPAAEAPPDRKVYQFTDASGVVHVTDDLASVPPQYRAKMTTH